MFSYYLLKEHALCSMVTADEAGMAFNLQVI